jgi:hypothetical protein
MAQTGSRNTFRKIIKLIGLLFIIWIGYLAYNWIGSVKEIQRVCSQIQPGQSKQEVIDIIEASKYLRHLESDDETVNRKHLLIFSSDSHGKATCSVELDGNVVIKSEYFQD